MSHLFGPSLMLTMCAALACATPTETLVARERAEPPPAVPTTAAARGRVQVVDGQLLSDISTPLRGLTLPVDTKWMLDDFHLMTTIAETTGLNTVHVFLENQDIETGSKLAEADRLVALTASAGLYMVLSYGGGAKPGEFKLEKLRAFWTTYAVRYASSTHVLYEIQNFPEETCDDWVQPPTIAMERELYQLIRGYAPDTHLMMFSTGAVPRGPVVEQAIDAVSDVVDFGNASFAMHTDVVCTPVPEIGSVVEAARAKHVPVLISALPPRGWPAVVQVAETAGVGWFHHNWLAFEPSLDTLFTAMRGTALGWCPDQGSYPGMPGGCP
ncbi:MAG TPA: hypothetical protein VHP33_33455 [Polyangiaceae bacterium]|nr:hypothetical protein [Polyangiaceae bacterium]